MAVKTKGEEKVNRVPEQIQRDFDTALEYQFKQTYWKDKFEDQKEGVVKQIEKVPADVLELQQGEGFEINANGQIIPSARNKVNFAAQKMFDFVKEKKIPIENLIACIKPDGFSQEKVEQLFGKVADPKALLPGTYTVTPGEMFFTFKSTPEFKASMLAQMEAKPVKMKKDKAA